MNQTINLTHLKFFCDTVTYESISEAAKMNFISQSAVSQAITKLETIFGVQLIFQNRQKLQVTDEGKIVFEQAKSIFKAVNNTFQMVKQSEDQISGTLRFVTTKSLGMSLLANSFKLIKQNLPNVDFKFRMGGPNTIRTSVKREEVDFAIVVYDDVNYTQFEKYPLRKGSLHLYQSKDIPSEMIEQEIFVCYHDCLYVPELKYSLKKRGIEPANITAVAGWDLAARFTELSLGVGFFPDYVLAENRYPNVIMHPFETPSFDYEICAIYNKGVKLSRAALLFLEQFKEG